MQELTQAELKRQLHYDPDTGIFTRIVSNHAKIKHGDIAGYIHKSVNGKRYRRITVNKKPYAAHRLAFLYMEGRFPVNQTDHKDGNGLENKWENLREVTRVENGRNQRLHNTNTSGFCGVCFIKNKNKWKAQISYAGKTIFLGYFSNKECAIAARVEANNVYGYHYNHGQIRPL